MNTILIIIFIIVLLFCLGAGGTSNHGLYGDSTTDAPEPKSRE
jgi:hypothetical protein